MTMRDIVSDVSLAASLAPAVRTDGTVNGTSVDLRGFGSAGFLVIAGAYTDGTHTPSAQHSDDNSSWAAVEAADLDGAFSAIAAAGAANSVQKVGYIGKKRYVRAVMTTASSTSGAASCVAVLRAAPGQAPV